MKRRAVIAGLAGAAATWPLGARAADPAPVIGYLDFGSSDANSTRTAAFLKGLREGGFVDGRNVAIEFRYASGKSDLMRGQVAEMIGRKVALLVGANTPAAMALKEAKTEIPTVFAAGGDPVALGLIASLSRPGANVTGATSMNAELTTKRFWLVCQLVPQAARHYAMINPASPLSKPFAAELGTVGASLGHKIQILSASSDAEIEAAFAGLPKEPGSVMLFGPDAFFYTRRAEIAALALRHGVPAIFDSPDYIKAGGLASYGVDFAGVLETAGRYAARVLKGEKPADLPVMQANQFQMTVNLKTAAALGITVPQTLLALADEVIE